MKYFLLSKHNGEAWNLTASDIWAIWWIVPSGHKEFKYLLSSNSYGIKRED